LVLFYLIELNSSSEAVQVVMAYTPASEHAALSLNGHPPEWKPEDATQLRKKLLEKKEAR